MRYKGSVVMKITFLLMTMALAVAMVACSGAAGVQGPAGPPGPPGKDAPTPEPTDPTEPTEPQPSDTAVAVITDKHTFRFNDAADGTFSKEPMMVNAAPFFHPGSGLMYTEDASADMKKIFDVQLSEDGMLTVTPMKADSAYKNHKFMVKAESPNGTSEMSTIYVRRNQPPRQGGLVAVADADVMTIWATSESKEIKRMDAEKDPTIAAFTLGEFIYVSLDGSDPASTTARPTPGEGTASDNAHFVDDEGNKLTFVPAPMPPSESKKLMVSGSEGMITLLGKETTNAARGAADSDTPIVVKLSAKDDGGLSLSDDPVKVFRVNIDTAPSKVGSIGLKSIELGAGAGTVGLTVVTNVTSYFKDDRDAQEELIYSAQSSDPSVVVVSGNPDNKKDVSLGDVTGNGDTAVLALSVDVKGRGTATITVKAKESADASDTITNDADGAPGQQSAEQMFMVEVK